MISFIISTYQPKLLEKLKNNIADTTGLPFEIIAVENNNAMGICKAYNQGATKSIYPYLCFVHEDVIFKTSNWAELLIKKFEQDTKTGLIGVAGTTYKSLAPGGWGNISKETDRLHIIQHYKDNRAAEYTNQTQSEFEPVACLDGVFLLTKRSIWEEIRFDDNTFTHFHCYDLDFSLSVSLNYLVLITNKVLLEHFSPGGMDINWIDETIKLSDKWYKFLPKGFLNKKNQTEIEWKQKDWTITKMILYKKNLLTIFKIYFGYGFFRFFSFDKAYQLLKLILRYTLTNSLKLITNA